MVSRVGFCLVVAVWGVGGGAVSFSVFTGISLKVGGGAGGSWPIFLQNKNKKFFWSAFTLAVFINCFRLEGTYF